MIAIKGIRKSVEKTVEETAQCIMDYFADRTNEEIFKERLREIRRNSEIRLYKAVEDDYANRRN